MAYSYYQQAPGWGTQQYQFAPPPAPSFRPEATWRGRDYFTAAAVSPDLSVFDTAYNRVRAGGANLGVGFHDARHWHRRAYGGLGEVNMMLPPEIGAAAAYEAYRTFIHNSSVFDPARFDDESQREALVGLAMAEATRLWHSTGRRMDRFGMQQACEAAAATVTVIMNQWSQDPYGASSSPYGGSNALPSTAGFDPYAYDEDAYRRFRGHRRRRSSGSPTSIVSIGGGAGGVPMPQPTTYYQSTSAPIPIGGTSSSYGGRMGQPLSVSPYGMAQPPLVNTVPQAMYGAQPYPASVPSGNTIVIPSSSPRSSRHHHHRHSSSREREREREREKERRRARRYSDASSYYYGQPTGSTTILTGGRPASYIAAPPIVAPSYTTAYRY